MHEFTLAEALLRAALEVAKAHGNPSVEKVRVRWGRMRQVVPDLLAFAFQALAQGTPAEGATLEWEEEPIQVRCRQCQAVFEAEDWFWACPRCGAPGGEVLAGDEFLLESVVLRNT